MAERKTTRRHAVPTTRDAEFVCRFCGETVKGGSRGCPGPPPVGTQLWCVMSQFGTHRAVSARVLTSTGRIRLGNGRETFFEFGRFYTDLESAEEVAHGLRLADAEREVSRATRNVENAEDALSHYQETLKDAIAKRDALAKTKPITKE